MTHVRDLQSQYIIQRATGSHREGMLSRVNIVTYRLFLVNEFPLSAYRVASGANAYQNRYCRYFISTVSGFPRFDLAENRHDLLHSQVVDSRLMPPPPVGFDRDGVK